MGRAKQVSQSQNLAKTFKRKHGADRSESESGDSESDKPVAKSAKKSAKKSTTKPASKAAQKAAPKKGNHKKDDETDTPANADTPTKPKEIQKKLAEARSTKTGLVTPAVRLTKLKEAAAKDGFDVGCLEVKKVGALEKVHRDTKLKEGFREADTVLFCEACKVVLDHVESSTARNHVKKSETHKRRATELAEKPHPPPAATATPAAKSRPTATSKFEAQADLDYVCTIGDFTTSQRVLLDMTLSKHFDLGVASSTRSINQRRDAHCHHMETLLRARLDSGLVGLGVDGGVLKKLHVPTMVVIAYLPEGTVVTDVRSLPSGDSYTTQRLSELMDEVVAKLQIKVAFYVLDRYSVNQAYCAQMEAKRAVVWCFGHHLATEAKRFYKERYPAGCEVCSLFSCMFAGVNARRRRWRKFQIDFKKDAQKELRGLCNKLGKIELLVKFVETGRADVESLAKHFPDAEDPLVAGKEWVATERSKSEVHEQTGSVQVDEEKTEAPQTTSQTRWCALFEVNAHIYRRRETLLAFLQSEMARSYKPASLRQLSVLLCNDEKRTKAFDEMGAMEERFAPLREFFLWVSNPPKGMNEAHAVHLRVRKAIRAAGPEEKVLLQQIWSSYKSRDLFEHLAIFDPESVATETVDEAVMAASDSKWQELFPALFTDPVLQQLTTYKQLDFDVLCQFPTASAFWHFHLTSELGDLAQVVTCLLTMPASVTGVDSIYSVASSMLTAAGTAPKTFCKRLFTRANGDIEGRFADQERKEALRLQRARLALEGVLPTHTGCGDDDDDDEGSDDDDRDEGNLASSGENLMTDVIDLDLV